MLGQVAVRVALLWGRRFDSRATEQSDANENRRRGEFANPYLLHVGSS
jgi:hypothetical protein